MGKKEIETTDQQIIQQVLGYLNFSAGAHDPSLLSNLNQLWASCQGRQADLPTWVVVGDLLRQQLSGHPFFLQVYVLSNG